MAKVKEITVSVKRTIGLPGYSSIGKEAFVTMTVDGPDDSNHVYRYAWKLVNDQVNGELKKYLDPDWINDDKAAGVQRKPVVKKEGGLF